jgi:rod shape-determining protein MreC
MSSFLKKYRSPAILLCLLLAQFILLSLQLPMGNEPSYLEKAVFMVTSPVQRGFAVVYKVIGDFWDAYFRFQSTREENQELAQELFYLKQENLLLKMRLRKIEEERDITSSLKLIHENILSARVIGLDQRNIYKSLIINRGTLDGIRKDMVVLDRHGNLLGRVINPVSFGEARVQLITDSEMGVAVYSEEKDLTGILKGDTNGFCSLDYILATDERVKQGQSVYTSGFDGVFPPSIPVGETFSVLEDKALFKSILVRPFFSLKDLDRVAVIMLETKSLF